MIVAPLTGVVLFLCLYLDACDFEDGWGCTRAAGFYLNETAKFYAVGRNVFVHDVADILAASQQKTLKEVWPVQLVRTSESGTKGDSNCGFKTQRLGRWHVKQLAV